MITRIELFNFMSHEHTVIELSSGLTVLVGENNTGKSAVISALQALCRNASGDFMVRHGKKDCRVTVSTSEGHELEWRRNKGVVSYTLNGRTVHRLRGSLPEDLHSLLRLPLVEAEKDYFDIHFGEQKDPIFLLNQSPAKRAAFFASSSDTSKLVEIQNVHRTKVQEAKAGKKQLRAEKERAEARMEILRPVDKIESDLLYLEKEHVRLLKVMSRAEKLHDLNLILEKKTGEVEVLQCAKRTFLELKGPPVLQVLRPLEKLAGDLEKSIFETKSGEKRAESLDPLVPPPELERTVPLRSLSENMDTSLREFEYLRKKEGVLSPLQPRPKLADTRGLQALIREMENTRAALGDYSGRKSALDFLANPPVFKECARLRWLTDQLEKGFFSLDRARQESAILEKCQPPPEQARTKHVKQLIKSIERQMQVVHGYTAREKILSVRLCPLPEQAPLENVLNMAARLEKAVREVKKNEKTLKDTKAACARAEKKLRAVVAKMGACPTCGQKMDFEHLVNRPGFGEV